MVQTKQEAIRRFSQLPLKNPASLHFLQHLMESPELLERISFVMDKSFLPNTVVVAQEGADGVDFELELGACQTEEIHMVNGRLVRHLHRSCSVCVRDPVEAVQALQHLRGRLYAVFLFAGEVPGWYRAVVEPNPATACDSTGRDVEAALGSLLSDQVELLLLAVHLRQQIDRCLDLRDREGFHRLAGLYNEVRRRCLWEL